jgi:hypothetical protein
LGSILLLMVLFRLRARKGIDQLDHSRIEGRLL